MGRDKNRRERHNRQKVSGQKHVKARLEKQVGPAEIQKPGKNQVGPGKNQVGPGKNQAWPHKSHLNYANAVGYLLNYSSKNTSKRSRTSFR